jgi:hypothetical protein
MVGAAPTLAAAIVNGCCRPFCCTLMATNPTIHWLVEWVFFLTNQLGNTAIVFFGNEGNFFYSIPQ